VAGDIVDVVKEREGNYYSSYNFHTITISNTDSTCEDVDIRGTLSPWNITEV